MDFPYIILQKKKKKNIFRIRVFMVGPRLFYDRLVSTLSLFFKYLSTLTSDAYTRF